MPVTIVHWVAFNAFILTVLGIDLWRFYRHPHPISLPEALWSTCGWILVAFVFNIWIYVHFGSVYALEFLTGYLVEKSLSVDNLFVFLIIFSHFKVPEVAKHQVLFYGVLGAIIMRAILISVGIVLVKSFEWVFPVFGIFLIVVGFRLAFKKAAEEDKIDQSIAYRWLNKHLPLTPTYIGQSFIVQQKGRWMATPLLLVLILIEVTDLVFALDSVPAILGITTDAFIVYTSNILAILGLRSLFFALENIMKSFHLLHYALAFILMFIGTKMVVIEFLHIPTWITLSILVSAISAAIGASLWWPLPENNTNDIHK